MKIHAVEVHNEFEETQDLNRMHSSGGWRGDENVGTGEYKGGEAVGEEGVWKVSWYYFLLRLV